MPSRLAILIQRLKGEDWLSPLIDAANERHEPERWVKPRLEIHPSGSGSPCPREIELGMLGHRAAVKAKNRRRMDNGTSLHDRWNKYFEEAGVLVEANVRVTQTEPFSWSGECDVICKNPLTGLKHVGELKSMNSHRWKNVPDQLPDRREMAQLLLKTERSYVYQLTQYIVKLEPLYEVEREGFFLFENTDTQEYKVRYIEPDAVLCREAFAHPLTAQKAALEGKLISPPFKQKSMTCRKCYRESLCYLLQDGDEELWERVQEALKTASGR